MRGPDREAERRGEGKARGVTWDDRGKAKKYAKGEKKPAEEEKRAPGDEKKGPGKKKKQTWDEKNEK